MRNSTVFVGLLFGVFVAGALAPPLYFELPYRLLDDWSYVNGEASMGGFVGAVVLPTFAGFLAALLDPDAAIRSGTSAGFLAVMIGGMLIGLPAAEVEATDSLLTAIKNGETHLDVLRAVSAESVLFGTWLPVATGMLLLGMGPALGAIGGVLFDLYSGSTGRSNRTVHRSSAPIFGLIASLAGTILATLWIVQLDLVILPNLDHPVGVVDRNLLSTPLFVASLVDCLLVSWVLRDSMLLWRSGLRAFATGWGGFALALCAASPISMLVIYPQCMLTAAPWLSCVALALTAIASLVGATRSELTLENDARTLGEFVGHGILTGITVVGALAYVGFAPVLGTYLVSFPYVRALLSGADTVEARPETLVSLTFEVHWAALLVIPVVAAAYVVGAAPFWLFVRAFSGRRD